MYENLRAAQIIIHKIIYIYIYILSSILTKKIEKYSILLQTNENARKHAILHDFHRIFIKYNQILYIATITAKIYCIWSRRVRNSEDCRYRFANIPKRAPPSLSYKPCRSLILLFQKNIV